MQTVPLTRATVLTPVIKASHHFNVPVEHLLRKRGLPVWEIDDPDLWVPTHAVVMLGQHIQQTLGPETFGLWMERACDLSALGPLGDTVRHSRTLYDALHRYRAFYRQFRSYANISLVRRAGDLWIRQFADRGSPQNSEILQLYAVDEMTKIVRRAAGDNWRPRRIVLRSDTGSVLTTMPDLNGADVAFGAAFTGIAIPLDLLSLPMMQREGSSIMEAADDTPPRSPVPECFADALSAIIATRFHDGYPGIDTVAESIGMNTRAVQRGLAKEGRTYRDLIDWHRFETARQIILEDRVRLMDIAAELGYNNAASFTRAFRRWAGVSPREYRTLHTAA